MFGTMCSSIHVEDISGGNLPRTIFQLGHMGRYRFSLGKLQGKYEKPNSLYSALFSGGRKRYTFV